MRPGYENKTQARTGNLVIGWTLKWYNSANEEKLTLRARSRRRAARGRRVLEKNCRQAPTVCCFKMGSNQTRDLRRSAPSSSRGSKTKSWSGPIAATAAPTALWSCRNEKQANLWVVQIQHIQQILSSKFPYLSTQFQTLLNIDKK